MTAGVRNVTLDYIDESEALRYLGYGENVPDEKTREMLQECEKSLLEVIDAKFVYRIFDLCDGQIKNSAFTMEGESVKRHLKNCTKAVLMCATLSSNVDKLIRSAQVTGMARALILDSLASAAVEQVCNHAEKIILDDFSEFEHTWRFGVGYGDFSLSEQKAFLSILDAPKRIGVCANSAMMLVPAKSVTCIIGIGKDLPKENAGGCENCNFRDRCQFRREKKDCGKQNF